MHPVVQLNPVEGAHTLLGGSWVVICRVVSRITFINKAISKIKGLIITFINI